MDSWKTFIHKCEHDQDFRLLLLRAQDAVEKVGTNVWGKEMNYMTPDISNLALNLKIDFHV